MSPVALVFAAAGIWLVALGVMVGALSVADFVVRTLRRKAGRP